MTLKKLYTNCGVHSNPLSLFTKFDVFHTFSVTFMLSENVWKNSDFLKATKDCYVLQNYCVVSLTLFVTFFKGKATNIFN